MEAGKLSERVVIQEQSEGEDGAGQRVLVWTDFATVWANVRMNNGKETVASGRENSVAAGSIRIRFRKDIVAGMRLLWSDMFFDIKAVLPDGAKREHVDLVVETGANDG